MEYKIGLIGCGTVGRGFMEILLNKSSALKDSQDFEARVDIAIERGVRYLRQQMEKEPWSGRGGDEHIMGRTAIEVYALIKSDVSVYDPAVQAALQHLNGLKPSYTYCVAVYLMALDAALSQIELELALGRGDPERKVRATGPQADAFVRRMSELTTWLLSARRKDGAVWDYGFSTNRFDNSNTQFALLGVWAAARDSLEIPARAIRSSPWYGLFTDLLWVDGHSDRWGLHQSRARRLQANS